MNDFVLLSVRLEEMFSEYGLIRGGVWRIGAYVIGAQSRAAQVLKNKAV